MKKLEVPNYVIEDVLKVRDSGVCNMFDSQNVLNALYDLKCYESVVWLFDENWKEGSYHSQMNKMKYSLVLQSISDLYRVADSLGK